MTTHLHAQTIKNRHMKPKTRYQWVINRFCFQDEGAHTSLVTRAETLQDAPEEALQCGMDYAKKHRIHIDKPAYGDESYPVLPQQHPSPDGGKTTGVQTIFRNEDRGFFRLEKSLT